MIHTPPCLPSILVATLMALAAAGLAQAEPAAELAQAIQQVTEQFKAADKNGDGVVTRAEVAAAFPESVRDFDEIDAAKSGKVTLEQVRNFIRKRMQENSNAKK